MGSLATRKKHDGTFACGTDISNRPENWSCILQNFETLFLAICIKNIIAHRLFSAMCEITYIAPLYLRPEGGLVDETWTANINDDAYSKLTQYLTEKPSPIDVFDYVYGVLHDPAYSDMYEQYLCRDFPRVPIINDKNSKDEEGAFFVSEDLFHIYVEIGSKLRKLHLLEAKTPAELVLDPNTSEDMVIGAVKYKKGMLQINPNKKISGIPQDVWDYQIGGHQVLDKWFKEHKGESLTIDTFNHIENIVGLLEETIRLLEYLRGLH